MKDIIKNLIKVAEQTEDFNLQCELLDEIHNLISEFVMTINCPCNWRDIGRELAEEYVNNNLIYEALQLWNYAD